MSNPAIVAVPEVGGGPTTLRMLTGYLPQEPYDFPLFNLEGGILYRLKAAKLFGKLVGVNHGINGNRVIPVSYTHLPWPRCRNPG